jgi:hypothetical protein
LVLEDATRLNGWVDKLFGQSQNRRTTDEREDKKSSYLFIREIRRSSYLFAIACNSGGKRLQCRENFVPGGKVHKNNMTVIFSSKNKNVPGEVT